MCSACQTLPPALFVPGSSVSHRIHTGPSCLESLGSSAEAGCPLCTTVLDAIRAAPDPDKATLDREGGILLSTQWSRLRAPDHTTRRYKTLSPSTNLHLVEAQVLHGNQTSPPVLAISWGRSNCRRLRFNVNDGRPNEQFKTTWDRYAPGFGVPRYSRPRPALPVNPEADSQETMSLLHRWIDTCQRDHKSTCAYVGHRVVDTDFSSPARLVYCGAKGLRLVDAAELPRDQDGFGPTYTALSYRWGSPASLHTTIKANLAASMQGLSFDDLPLTFQHAIRVTRAIGVIYIWIDALCIVQDDEADKDREISRMDLIYSTSICMISASCSRDTHSGIFHARPPAQAHLHPFTLTTTQVKGGGSLSVTIQPYLADWGNAITDGSIYSRGWCFQERQLSKRIIYFTETRLLWECRFSVASEGYPEMIGTEEAKALFAPNMPSRITMECLGDPTLLPWDPRRSRPWIEDWCRVVETYSGRDLTYPSDRLLALAGLAAFFEGKLRNPRDPDASFYAAGMWKEDLAKQLAWFPDYASRTRVQQGGEWPLPLRKASNFRDIEKYEFLSDWLPSLSWISLSGPVHYAYSSATTDAPPPPPGLVIDVGSKGPALPLVFYPMEVTGLKVMRPIQQAHQRFGSVTGGYVGMTGNVAVVTISEDDLIKNEDDLLILPSLGEQRPKLYTMFRRPQTTTLFSRLMPGNKRRRAASADGIIFFDADPPELPAKTRIHCLRLGTGPSAFSSMHGAVDYGLALMEVYNCFELDIRGGVRRMDGQDPQEMFPRMRRVGLFEVDVWNKKWPEQAVKTSVVVI